jgi:hypothetical protein
MQLLQNRRIVIRRRDHRDILVILSPGTDQRRPADVDVLDQLRHARALLRGHFLEGVKIHDHHVDGRNLVLGQRFHVFGIRADGEHSTGDPRIDGLQTPVQHLRKSGHLGYFLHLHAAFVNRSRRSTR